jgi:hypothetical protein
MKKILFLLMFLLTITFTIAYDNSSLKLYLTMGDGSGLSVYDSVTGYNFVSTYILNNSVGKVGNSLYAEQNSTSIINTTWTGYNTNYSINFWMKDTDGLNTIDTVMTLYTNVSLSEYIFFSIRGNTTTIKNITVTQVLSGGSTITYILNSSLNYDITQWHMFTFVFNENNKNMSGYVDGELIGRINITDRLTLTSKGIKITWNKGQYLDELSFWYSQRLNKTDIEILYNDGNGISYAETLISGGEYIPVFNEIWHNYCVFNIACNNYNVSNDICDDSPLKVCDENCADTFDTYQSVGQENVTASFSANCYPNSSLYTYQFPTYEGFNTSSLLYNICLGHYLCRAYNLTTGCEPALYNGTPNKIDCNINQSSILAECTDESKIYFNTSNIYPPNYDFHGTCNVCISDCSIENATSCYDIANVQKCKKYQSCLKLFTILTCSSGTSCYNGLCQKTIPPSNEKCFFCSFSITTKYWIMLIASILILIIITILLAIFGDGLAGVLVGLVISMLTSLTLTLIFELSLLIPILYIIIGGSIATIIGRKVFMG